MRALLSPTTLLLGLALTLWSPSGEAQSDRDFVFTDGEGHLVIRFAGTGASGLDASQAYEVLNAELSTMVHDRLHADLAFEREPRDTDWGASMELEIAEHVRHAGATFSDVFVQCRAASCRLIMEQPGHWSVAEHRAVLETVQASLQNFIASHRRHFEPVFLIAAYDQEYETSHIKAFLRRSEHAPPDELSGG